MLEYSQQWTLVGPDGTTVIFNDGISGLILEDVAGFDGAPVRLNVEDLPESDGAVAGDSYLGQRPVTLTGRVAAASASARNATVVSLQQALRALKGDLTLKSQASGLPAMQAKARLAAPLRLSGGYVKAFQIALVCPDPRIYSQTLNQGVATGAVSAPGASFSWVFPVNFGGGTGATQVVNVTNAGNFATAPIVRVWGPIANPQITNATQALSLYLDSLTLVAGEYVDVDLGARTVTKSDGSNLYSKVRFPGSSWWTLNPGSSTVQLWGTGTSGSTELDVSWRDAWA